MKRCEPSPTAWEHRLATADNTGATRPLWEQTISLAQAIEQNKVSRIYLGVHWLFDATGGEVVGKAVAAKAITAFK